MPVSAIEVHDLDVALGGSQILHQISFSVPPGQRVALLGGNGSGKTTLLRAILGLVAHQSGKIALWGTPLESFSDWDLLGYVPQRASVSLHSTTVAEVVGSGVLAKRPLGWMTRKDRRAVAEALDEVGMADHAKELYLHLSGGQQQRVLIARGIVSKPKLIIMDEPFAGVDLDNQASMAAMLKDSDATVFVVLHETGPIADLLDSALVLDNGWLVYDGPPSQAKLSGSHESQPPQRNHILTGMEPQWAS